MAVPVRAVLWDLDCTLVDTEKLSVDAFVRAHRECAAGLPLSVPDFRRYFGLPIEEILELMGLPQTMADAWRAACADLRELARPYQGAREILEELRQSGVRMAIITGRDRAGATTLLRQTGLAGFFEAMTAADGPVAPKPAPDGVWVLCDELGVCPSRTVLVGDACGDMMAGRAAGIRTIACTWGTGDPAELAEHRPWRFAHQVAELQPLLGLRPVPCPAAGRTRLARQLRLRSRAGYGGGFQVMGRLAS